MHQKYVFWSNNILCELRGKLECYLSQTCIHTITAQYAARVLHFSASSLLTLCTPQDSKMSESDLRKIIISHKLLLITAIRLGSLVVKTLVYQPMDRGSSPDEGNFFFFFSKKS